MIEYVVRAVFVYYVEKLEFCLAFLFSAIYSINMGVINYDKIQTIDKLRQIGNRGIL